MNSKRSSSLLLLTALPFSLLLVAANATAHIKILEPEARVPDADDLKASPCGPGNNWGQGAVNTVAPGQTVRVVWDETILHPGYFRVALSVTGDPGLTKPSEEVYTTANANLDMVPDPIVAPEGTADGSLLMYYDYYEQHAQGCAATPPPDGETLPSGKCIHWVEVVMPAECEQCTLQVVQMMADGRPYASAYYYQCIDITVDPSLGGGGAGGASGMEGGAAGMTAMAGSTAAAGVDGMGGAAGMDGMGMAGAPGMAGGGNVMMGFGGMMGAGGSGGAGMMTMAGTGASVVPTAGMGAGGGGVLPATGVSGANAAGMPSAAGDPGLVLNADPAPTAGGCSVVADKGTNDSQGAAWAAALALLSAGGLRRRRAPG